MRKEEEQDISIFMARQMRVKSSLNAMPKTLNVYEHYAVWMNAKTEAHQDTLKVTSAVQRSIITRSHRSYIQRRWIEFAMG